MIARILISKDKKIRVGEIKSILEAEKLTDAHPDVLYFKADSKLGVAEAKQIREFFSIKPYQSKGRVLVLEDAGALTPDAQNSLLKTLEEPPEKAIILFGAESEDEFIPTILSRCEVINLLTPEIDDKYTEDIAKLVTEDIGERFDYIEKLKDAKKRQEFLYSLTSYFHSQLPDEEAAKFLKELLVAEEWAKGNANIRGILEYLMLTMPGT